MKKILNVLEVIKRGEWITADTVMERTGYTRAEAGQALNRLWNTQQLVRVDRGVYRRKGDAPALVGHMRAGRPHGAAPTVFRSEHPQ